MTLEQLSLAYAEAPNYTDEDAYVSDLALSSAFLPEDPESLPDEALVEQLRRIWRTANAPFRALLDELDLSQMAFSRRFGVPLRTVQGWALGERSCPSYVRRMAAELLGYAPIPD